MMNDEQANWPQEQCFASFKHCLPVCRESVYSEFFEAFREDIKVKRESAAVKNLKIIFDATFELASKGGFDAMSLRDLSQSTGISMGGLYNYIRSKDMLAQMVNDFLSQRLAPLAYSLNLESGSPRQRLATRLRIYIYMGSLFRPWYRFVYMESKSMARQQRDQAKQFDLIDTAKLKELIEEGVAAGEMHCSNSELTASALLALIQDWYLKSWKYKQNETSTDDYANFLVSLMDKLLADNDQQTHDQTGYNDHSGKNNQ
ncbi:MAG: TetR/AcrR family transcriptional regulator [Cellvibrionaceae bacterium]|nr:TetR/AcrR family transcriptional regulator [Cellvibrionaceae bacterium]